MLISVFIASLVSFAGASSAQDHEPFKPITCGLNFKAYFRAQAFANQESIYSGDIYESYHSQLGTGLIKQTSFLATQGRPISKRYLYDSRAKQIVEFTDQQEISGHNDFYLYENGGSGSYLVNRLQRDIRKESVRFIPEHDNIDSILLMGQERKELTLPKLNLDQFMTPECLEVLRKTGLHYIRGLMRLLHVIECRRNEFKLQQPVKQQIEMTRGQTRQVYRSGKLEAISNSTDSTDSTDSIDSNFMSSLEMLVTIHQALNSASATLESGSIPLSIVLNCEPALSILINVYQFESIGSDDHLSESASGHSIYLMPLAQPSLSHLLASAQIDRKQLKDKPGVADSPARSFSFQASLTGSHLSQFYQDPIELSVSYDAQLGALATWSTFTDRTQSDGLTGWLKPTIRRLHDSSSGLTFHLMESNFNYLSEHDHEPEGPGEPSEPREQPKWRACATDKLTASEINQLQVGSDGYLFDLASATYMGEALVRGIRCQVYERRLYELPAMLDMSENDYVHLSNQLAQSKLYLNLYAYGDHTGTPAQVEVKFARLDLSMVSHVDESQRRVLTLEISAFDWTSSGVQGRDSFSGADLLARLSQECLLMVPGARHLDMELWFGPAGDRAGRGGATSGQSRERPAERATSNDCELLALLASDREARDHSVREMLATSELGLSAIQQVDLVTEIQLLGAHKHPNFRPQNFDHGQFLYAKFSLYELWHDSVDEQFLGYARSLNWISRGTQAGNLALVLGARSYSYNECKWRAVHSLLPDRKRSEINRRDDDEHATANRSDLRLFMYCPARLVCLLGDASWTPMSNRKPLKLDNLLDYPYVAPAHTNGGGDDLGELISGEDPAKCVLASVLIKQQVASVRGQTTVSGGGHQSGRPQLDWWLMNGATGLGRANESIALQKVRELRLDLKVKGSSASATEANSSMGVRVNKLKLSNRVFINPSDGNESSSSSSSSTSGDIDESDVSLLIKPLVGLAYMPATASAHDTRPLAGAIINSQPFVADSLAGCSRACLHSHECQSFSACHEQQRESGSGGGSTRHSVNCILSRLSWANELEFQKLVRLTRTNNPSQSVLILEVTSPTTFEDHTSENVSEHEAPRVQVQLRQSQLCSIRSRPQMDLYRMARSHLDNVPGPKYLIPARSLDQCARLCQERAQLRRELEEVKSSGAETTPESVHIAGLGTSFRSAACHMFRFSHEGSYCQLLPLQNHWAILGLEHMLLTAAENSASGWRQPGPVSWLAAAHERRVSLPTLSKWLRLLGDNETTDRHTEWLAKLRVLALSEADHYDLDFEQIFLAQRNRRLIFSAEVPQKDDELTGSQPQVRLTQFSLYECAKRCLQLVGCRSFDVEMFVASRPVSTNDDHLVPVVSGGQQRAQVCQLNVISAADLSVNPSAWPSFKLNNEQQQQQQRRGSCGNSSTTEWWHYEPSELALFIISDPGEPGLIKVPPE